jgi:hypothetical protein
MFSRYLFALLLSAILAISVPLERRAGTEPRLVIPTGGVSLPNVALTEAKIQIFHEGVQEAIWALKLVLEALQDIEFVHTEIFHTFLDRTLSCASTHPGLTGRFRTHSYLTSVFRRAPKKDDRRLPEDPRGTGETNRNGGDPRYCSAHRQRCRGWGQRRLRHVSGEASQSLSQH